MIIFYIKKNICTAFIFVTVIKYCDRKKLGDTHGFNIHGYHNKEVTATGTENITPISKSMQKQMLANLVLSFLDAYTAYSIRPGLGATHFI